MLLLSILQAGLLTSHIHMHIRLQWIVMRHGMYYRQLGSSSPSEAWPLHMPSNTVTRWWAIVSLNSRPQECFPWQRQRWHHSRGLMVKCIRGHSKVKACNLLIQKGILEGKKTCIDNRTDRHRISPVKNMELNSIGPNVLCCYTNKIPL